MPASIGLLRIILGLIGAGCAAMAARALVRARRGGQKRPKPTGWLIRTVLCLAGVMFRHPVDAIDIGVWVLLAAASGLSWWITAHPKPEEDLTNRIFPGDE